MNFRGRRVLTGAGSRRAGHNAGHVGNVPRVGVPHRVAIVAAALSLVLPSACLAGTQGLLHPPVRLLDETGKSVLESGKPVSTIETCAGCHDTHYIATHSYHVTLGSDEISAPGAVPGGHAWDYSPGPFGRWNPLLYRYLSPPGDRQLDLGTGEWIQQFGWRQVGGGPAWSGHGAEPLSQLSAGSPVGPDSHVLNPADRSERPWDWQKSGAVEMNCFLCHVDKPDNRARNNELAKGHFQWANTATLLGTGIVATAPGGWTYRRDGFGADGAVDAAKLGLRAAKSENCGLCHGMVHMGEEPLKLDLSLRQWSTATKGQVFSPQRISESAINLQDKSQLTRPWDVHAERLLECTNCHFSINRPVDYEPTPRTRPEHLRFEPRRLSIGEYLQRPSHQFAKGHTAQAALARHLDGTMRACADCHDARPSHRWLPYLDAHLDRLSCEACHTAEVRAPAMREVDWTLISPDGRPRTQWRGVEGDPQDPTALVTGFHPALLPRKDLDGHTRLVPQNLVTAWYWVEGGPNPRPVRLADLQAALLSGQGYRPEIAAALDADRNGAISAREALLDTPEKVAAVRKRLLAIGVQDPRIEAEIQPYGIHHGVGPAHWATRKCEACHGARSRLAEPLVLATSVPGGILPRLRDESVVELRGDVRAGSDGRLTYYPSTRDASLYVLGHDRWMWINVLGAMAVAGVFGGAVVHAIVRILSARQGHEKARPS